MREGFKPPEPVWDLIAKKPRSAVSPVQLVATLLLLVGILSVLGFLAFNSPHTSKSSNLVALDTQPTRTASAPTETIAPTRRPSLTPTPRPNTVTSRITATARTFDAVNKTEKAPTYTAAPSANVDPTYTAVPSVTTIPTSSPTMQTETHQSEDNGVQQQRGVVGAVVPTVAAALVQAASRQSPDSITPESNDDKQPTIAPISSSTTPPTPLDLYDLLPRRADVPDGLIELRSGSRTLNEVASGYPDPEVAIRKFGEWGWESNVTREFGLPDGQQVQSGVLNDVYVSIHEFAGPAQARSAVDYSLTAQEDDTSLQEIEVGNVGDYTRGLLGMVDDGTEVTILSQKDNLLIRVSATMLNGHPTDVAQEIMAAIVAKTPGHQDGKRSDDGARGWARYFPLGRSGTLLTELPFSSRTLFFMRKVSAQRHHPVRDHLPFIAHTCPGDLDFCIRDR